MTILHVAVPRYQCFNINLCMNHQMERVSLRLPLHLSHNDYKIVFVQLSLQASSKAEGQGQQSLGNANLERGCMSTISS